jgi:hypothetical protein
MTDRANTVSAAMARARVDNPAVVRNWRLLTDSFMMY